MSEYFQFNVKIDPRTDAELVEFLLFVRKNRKFNSVVRQALRDYMDKEQYDLLSPLERKSKDTNRDLFAL
jgi:hypothetical protein